MTPYAKYYIAICVIAVCIGLVPLFIADLQPRIREISVSSTLGDVLRTSVKIKVMAGVSIGTTLPIMVDAVLDKFSNIALVDLTNTFIVLMVIIVFGTSYLTLNDQYYMTYLHVTLFFVVKITFATIMHSFSRGVQWKP